jgi:hypothetical protein
MNYHDLFIVRKTDKFQLSLLDPKNRNISQENSNIVLEKFFFRTWFDWYHGITQDSLQIFLHRTIYEFKLVLQLILTTTINLTIKT